MNFFNVVSFLDKRRTKNFYLPIFLEVFKIRLNISIPKWYFNIKPKIF